MRRLTLRRRRRLAPGSRLMTAGFVGGVVAGLFLWSVQMRRSKRDLFASNPVKRLAALGYLGGQDGVESAQLLSEYISWEKQPMLRKRAERLLKRMRGRLV